MDAPLLQSLHENETNASSCYDQRRTPLARRRGRRKCFACDAFDRRADEQQRTRAATVGTPDARHHAAAINAIVVATAGDFNAGSANAVVATIITAANAARVHQHADADGIAFTCAGIARDINRRAAHDAIAGNARHTNRAVVAVAIRRTACALISFIAGHHSFAR